MSLFSPPHHLTTLSFIASKPHLSHKSHLSLFPKKSLSRFLSRSADNGAGVVGSAVVEENLGKKEETPLSGSKEEVVEEKKGSLESNGSVMEVEAMKFKDPRWVGGTWDLKQFEKDGKPNWDAVIDAEVRRRKWLEDNPETSSNESPVVFNTAIIPWWAWIKRFHLPEAELLNGRAAMIGFFMAYFVDSLTGVGLVDQMGNFFCKTLLFVAVVGVLLIRKNEDIDNLKKLIDETTFYDKQWQASWKDKSKIESKSDPEK